MRNNATLTDISHEYTVVAAVFGSDVNSQEVVEFVTGIVEDRLSPDSPYSWRGYVDKNWDLSPKEIKSLERTIVRLRAKAEKHMKKTTDIGYAIFKVVPSIQSDGSLNLAIVTVGDRRIVEWEAMQERQAMQREEEMQQVEVYRPVTVNDEQRERRILNDYATAGDYVPPDRVHGKNIPREFRVTKLNAKGVPRNIPCHPDVVKQIRLARFMNDHEYGYRPSLSESEQVACSRALDRELSTQRQALLDKHNSYRAERNLPPVESLEEDYEPSNTDNLYQQGFDYVTAALKGSRSH